MTLIEIVAAMALLSALLATTLLAFGRHQRQLQKASQSIDAITLLDQLLVDWFSSEDPFPVNARGMFADYTDVYWSSEAIGRIQLADQIDTIVLRVSVFDSRDAAKALATVELVDRYPDQGAAAGDPP